MKRMWLLLLVLVGLNGFAFGDEVYGADATRGRAAVAGRANGGVANSLRGMSRTTASRATTVQPRAVSGRGSASNSSVARSGTTTTTTTTTLMTASGGSHTGATSNSGRVAMRSASASARTPSIASVSVSNNNNVITNISESVKTVTSNLESLAELSDYCKSQYTECMDNFCNVLDDNQGRCSCSKNVKNYEKTEEALRAATEVLQEVAQNIQYIGLTPREINTLFEQTEAELAMQTANDNSKIKNDLDRIKNMIVGVKSGSSSAAVTENSGISIDFSNLLSFNIDSYGFDLSGLFGTTTTQSTQSIGNQRGEALYKSAAARCKTAVLNNCSAQGVDVAVMVNAYDMEIDKQCVQYERALTDSNDQMLATVRNAKTVLQKARLMISQQKNQYDLRGCVSALDSCMQDDYVCGNDYEECLDPTGKYIVSGEVVVGSMPGEAGGEWNSTRTAAASGLYTVWNVNGTGNQNIWGPSPSNTYTVSQYANVLKLEYAKSNAPKDISQYLQTKIGWHDDTSGRNYGMCMSVLNKCQKYTYDRNGKYMADNQIISEYMQRAFRQIKTAQDAALSKYAQNCLSDVTSCLSQNNYFTLSTTSSSGSNPSDIAIKACLSVINTCRSVTLGLSEADVTPGDLSDIYVWLDAGIGTKYQEVCENSGGTWTPKTTSTYDGSCSCDGDGLEEATSLNNKYCVCSTSGYKWSAADQACVESSTASSSSSGSGSGSGSQSGGDSTQTNVQARISLNKNGGYGGLASLYTVQNIGVYTNTARTSQYEMGVGTNCISTPTKSGYTFKGYYSTVSSGTQYINSNGCLTSAGFSEAKSYATTEYWQAQWEQTTTNADITITLNQNGGSGGTSTLYTTQNTGVYTNNGRTIAMGTSSNCITTPSKSGYSFKGYYSATTSGTQYIGSNGCIVSAGLTAGKAATSNQTWYAQWEQNQTTLTLAEQLQQNCNNSGGDWETSAKHCECARSQKHWSYDTDQCESEMYINFSQTALINNESSCKEVLAEMCGQLLGARTQSDRDACANDFYDRAFAIAGGAYASSGRLTGSNGNSSFGVTVAQIYTPMSSSNNAYVNALGQACEMSLSSHPYGVDVWNTTYSEMYQ